MKNLEALRIRERMSREELAKKLDVSYMTIRNWERGNTEPGASQLIRLAAIFAVSVDQLLGRESQNE